MPERDRVLRPRGGEHLANRDRPAVREVERREAATQRVGRVLTVRRPGAEPPAHCRQETERDDRAAVLPVELDVPARDVDQPVADRVDGEGVGASEVHRGPGGRLHEEQSRRCVHFSVDLTAIEGQAVVGALRPDQTNPRVGPHLDVPNVADEDHGAGGIVGLKAFADSERAGRGKRCGADPGQARHARHLPDGAVARDAPTAREQQRQHGRGGERHQGPPGKPARPTLPGSRFPPARDPGFDSGPEIARRLDALRELRDVSQ